jgi:hypothetical protein
LTKLHYVILAPTADIVGFPVFESAVVKVQGARSLTRQERAALQAFRETPEAPDDDEEEAGYAERVLKRARSADTEQHYPLVEAVAPTSNVVERRFSAARLAIGLSHSSLQPITLEALMFLKVDRHLWDAHDVHECLGNN